jgi:hypothetical protein
MESCAAMVETNREAESAERAFWLWLGFWVQFALLGLFVVIGAFAASGAEQPGDYGAGVVLVVCALALAFLRLKQRFDGGAADWRAFLLVDDMASLTVAIPLFVVIGLAGLFVAADWRDGALHDAGIGLFVASGIIVFLDIKRVFDRIDDRRS